MSYRLDHVESVCQTSDNVFPLAVQAPSPHRSLAEVLAADARDLALGEVLTPAELGLPMNWRGFGGLWAPRGLPAALVRQLEAPCLEATASDTCRSVMASAAQVVAPLDAQRFGDRLAAEQREAHSPSRGSG